MEVRKPFFVQRKLAEDCNPEHDRFAVFCKGSKPVFPNTHGDTEVVSFFTANEAQSLADQLNRAFVDYFDV